MKHLKMLVFTLFVTTAVFAQAQGKIAYINSQDLLQVLPEAKDANAKLTAYAKEFEIQFQSYYAEYQALAAELTNNTTLSEVAREAKLQDAATLEQRLAQYEQESNTKIEAKKAELFQPIITSELLEENKVQQREILELFAPTVNENGHLVYVTCSILPSEGEKQVFNIIYLWKHTT